MAYGISLQCNGKEIKYTGICYNVDEIENIILSSQTKKKPHIV